MKTEQLFIPDKIKVGFCNRKDTYTQKLAYIIYFDQKGVLRKEKSWQSWRDETIEPKEFDNVPTEGFVLNKGVGGGNHGWHSRNEYIRVYDPRDFEFEISIANLLFILKECDCSRGKGLEGNFVYSWNGTELVLLPTTAQDYKNSKNYTELQACDVKVKDLVPGISYQTKKQENLIYLGRFNFHRPVQSPKQKAVYKTHVFWNDKNFVYLNDLKSIAKPNSDIIAPNYAELVDQYYKSPHGSKVVELFAKQNAKDNYYWHHLNDDGSYLECYTNYNWHDKTKIDSVQITKRISFKNNILMDEPNYYQSYPPNYKIGFDNYLLRNVARFNQWIEPTKLALYVRLESGEEFRFAHGCIYKEKHDE